jgi:hypothetical protein
MGSRIWFLSVTAFFLLMNALLWRSEFGRKPMGSPVPPASVWKRMLQCSDPSKLEIRQRGQRLGSFEWRPTLVEIPPAAGADVPEGMVQGIAGYRIDIDQGNLYLKDLTYFGFNFDLNLTTNYEVQVFQLALSVRSRSEPRLKFAIRGDAARQELTVAPALNGDGRPEQVIPFEDLRSPERLLQHLGGPFSPAALAAIGLPLAPMEMPSGSAGLEWTAVKGHRVPLGRALVPVYRLHARLFERFSLNIYVTEGGEIFRVDLPGEITLFNEKLANL